MSRDRHWIMGGGWRGYGNTGVYKLDQTRVLRTPMLFSIPTFAYYLVILFCFICLTVYILVISLVRLHLHRRSTSWWPWWMGCLLCVSLLGANTSCWQASETHHIFILYLCTEHQTCQPYHFSISETCPQWVWLPDISIPGSTMRADMQPTGRSKTRPSRSL